MFIYVERFRQSALHNPLKVSRQSAKATHCKRTFKYNGRANKKYNNMLKQNKPVVEEVLRSCTKVQKYKHENVFKVLKVNILITTVTPVPPNCTQRGEGPFNAAGSFNFFRGTGMTEGRQF